MRPMTAPQRRTLVAFAGYVVEHGRAPTLRELGLMLGIRSTNAVNDHLRALQRRGLVRFADKLTSRGMQLTLEAAERLEHPVEREAIIEQLVQMKTGPLTLLLLAQVAARRLLRGMV